VLIACAGKKPALMQVLQNLDVTVAVVDVVKEVVLSKKAGSSFLEGYISNAIKNLNGIRDNNEKMVRKVRMFCNLMAVIVQRGEKLTSATVLDLNGFCEDQAAKGIKEAEELNRHLME
jgi:hypothetical protein